MWQIDEYVTGNLVDDLVSQLCKLCNAKVATNQLETHKCASSLVG